MRFDLGLGLSIKGTIFKQYANIGKLALKFF
jgi:hypothetical protein